MATLIRPEISKKNRYWIDKHRHYELKHFCLQYPTWKREIIDVYNVSKPLSLVGRTSSTTHPGDPTANLALKKITYTERIEMIERIARETDGYLYKYILSAVTEGLSYIQLKTKHGIPCSRDTYYDRYRRFFWLLSQERN